MKLRRFKWIELLESYWYFSQRNTIERIDLPGENDIIASGRFQCHDSIGRPRATADREDRLIARSAVKAPDSSLSTIRLFSDESHFQLCPDDHRRRVWRHPGQGADPAFTIAGYKAQQYIDDILRPILLPFLLQYPGLIFQQDITRLHTARVAINCLTACQTLSWPARSLSNRACLGYQGKAIASTREC
ncbi:transposable element Tc1 transposase [Trichonephila clavipes]|nr:transposable element Tc1 transposase [Trichonephila clavipes]